MTVRRSALLGVTLLGVGAGILLFPAIRNMARDTLEPMQIVGVLATVTGILSIWIGVRGKSPTTRGARRRQVSMGVVWLVLAVSFFVEQDEAKVLFAALGGVGLLAIVLRFPRSYFTDASRAPDPAA